MNRTCLGILAKLGPLRNMPSILKSYYALRGMVKNLPLLRRAGNNGRPWVHAAMCGNIYSDICMIIHASTL